MDQRLTSVNYAIEKRSQKNAAYESFLGVDLIPLERSTVFYYKGKIRQLTYPRTLSQG